MLLTCPFWRDGLRLAPTIFSFDIYMIYWFYILVIVSILGAIPNLLTVFYAIFEDVFYLSRYIIVVIYAESGSAAVSVLFCLQDPWYTYVSWLAGPGCRHVFDQVTQFL